MIRSNIEIGEYVIGDYTLLQKAGFDLKDAIVIDVPKSKRAYCDNNFQVFKFPSGKVAIIKDTDGVSYPEWCGGFDVLEDTITQYLEDKEQGIRWFMIGCESDSEYEGFQIDFDDPHTQQDEEMRQRFLSRFLKD